MKTLLILLFPLMMFSQNTISTLVGYKSFEVNYKIKGNLNYGIAISITDSKQIANRANKMDPNPLNFHRAIDKISPSLFLLIGGTFNNVTITGKIGATYFNQTINNIKEPQNIYRSVGVEVQYKNFILSHDATSSIMIGYEFNLN